MTQAGFFLTIWILWINDWGDGLLGAMDHRDALIAIFTRHGSKAFSHPHGCFGRHGTSCKYTLITNSILALHEITVNPFPNDKF